MRRGSRLRTVGGLVALAMAVATATVSAPLVLDVVGLRKLAFAAVQAGYAQDALEFTDALLQRDPRDASALAIRAQALRALGRADEAKATARAAWAAADNRPARFGAAMAMAQALSTDGQRGAAQWWLRRAAQNAPNARAEAVAKRDFGYVKSRNPWDLQISASAAPSSNVNNGSEQDSLTLSGLPFAFEIPPGSQALSGFETGLGLRGTYRFSPTGPARKTRAHFAVLGQSVALSAEARDKAPEVSGSDFSYAAVEAGVQHSRALDPKGTWTLHLGVTGGHNWYGGVPLSDYLQLEAGVERKLDAKSAVSVGVAADRIWRIDSPVQSSERIEVSLGYGRRVPNGDQLTVGLTGARAVSDSAEVGNEALGLSLGWAKAEAVGGIALSAGLGIETRAFAQSRYVTGGRDDVRLTASLSMAFEEVDYMGFSPVVNLQATRNRSNAALYDTQDFGITLGIKSSF